MHSGRRRPHALLRHPRGLFSFSSPFSMEVLAISMKLALLWPMIHGRRMSRGRIHSPQLNR
ncbi:hypothetical protein E2C01_083667 [Portunus trituberculatus]|uniref:Uncharacterized protein n=1 Tax=Portunus trituberculatus TaxID=210409 RepID=A0A5B7J5G8_PORTR|nr:hypothetical protein [Portunus trituberculatus]